jgi:hypothetical protein
MVKITPLEHRIDKDIGGLAKLHWLRFNRRAGANEYNSKDKHQVTESGHKAFSRREITMSGTLRYRIIALVCILLIGAASAATPPTVKSIDAPENLLFVGNSFTFYNNGLHNHVRRLIEGAGKKLGTTRAMAISGASLAQHAPALPAQIDSVDWDVVILQGHSLEAIRPEKTEGFRQAVRELTKDIRESGATPVLFMTWARTGQPEQTALLDRNYTAAGNETGALVVPVGLAFDMSTQADNGIVLRMDDRRHPTLAGSYLAACTFYAALFGESPVGNPYTASLDENVAAELQMIAWDTVRNYYGVDQ